MRLLRIFIFTIFLTLPATAQEKFELGFHAAHAQFSDKSGQTFGFMLHIPVADKWTLNYNFGIGPATEKRWYAHIPVGAVGGVALLDALDVNGNTSTLGLLLMFIPEGVGYYINTEGRMLTHISVNPLGFDYFKRGNPYYEFSSMSGDISVRLKIPFGGKYFLAPQIGGRLLYKGADFAFTAGVSLGMDLGSSAD